jgi:Major intrinsic protein
VLGTFFLVLVAAGGAMMGQAFPNTIRRTAAVVAPGLMVMAIILFVGKVSGAHLNPAVSRCLLAPRRLPVASRARVHHRAADRRHARGAVPVTLGPGILCTTSFANPSPPSGFTHPTAAAVSAKAVAAAVSAAVPAAVSAAAVPAVLIGHSGGAGGSACAMAWPRRSVAEMPSSATTADK